MGKSDIVTLNVLVAGDPSSVKENFIKRFLSYYPSSAQILRKQATLHVIHKIDKNIKIQLHDVHDLKTVDSKFNDMDVVFFCYTANDPKSFRNLEKWIGMLQVDLKKALTFLVVDMNQVSRQEAKLLADQAAMMKERFGIDHFIESSFDIQDSAFRAFLTILNKASSSELYEDIPLFELYDEHTQKIPEGYLKEMPSGFFRQNQDKTLNSYCRNEEIFRRDKIPLKLLQFVSNAY